MSPVTNWLLLSIISLRDSLPELIVMALLSSPPGSVLYNKQFILFIDTDILTILSYHYFSSNSVLLIVLLVVIYTGSGIKISQFFFSFFSCVFIRKLFQNSLGNLGFDILCLSSNFSEVVSWVVTLSDLTGHFGNELGLVASLTIDSCRSIVKYFIS